VSGELGLDRRFLIIGGGPAGLTAAYELTKLGFPPVEKLDTVGGLARTVNYKGFCRGICGRLDLGVRPERGCGFLHGCHPAPGRGAAHAESTGVPVGSPGWPRL
jgi:hypothetical protein